MPKYNVGDVAALFPKPKESTTETGKKLQSLFSDFHAKRNKSNSQSPKKHSEATKKITEGENEEIKNKSKFMKGKKRKLSTSCSLESDVANIIKKFKKSNDFEETTFSENKEEKVKNNLSVDTDFSRKQKGKKFSFDNSKSNYFFGSDVAETSGKPSFVSNKVSYSNSHSNDKQVSGFIKKSKHQNSNKLNETANSYVAGSNVAENVVHQKFMSNKEGKVKNSLSGEADFPRKKKNKKFSFGNSKGYDFSGSDAVDKTTEKPSFMSNKVSFSNTNSNDKQVSGFMKKLKHQNANKLEETAGSDVAENVVKQKYMSNKEKKGKTNSLVEVDFPRRKKRKFSFDNSKSNDFAGSNVTETLAKTSYMPNKASYSDTHQNTKQGSGIIKNANKCDEGSSTKESVKQPLYTNDYSGNLCKNEKIKKKIKKPKKKKVESTPSYGQNSSVKLNEPDFLQIPDNKEGNVTVQNSNHDRASFTKKVGSNETHSPGTNINDEEVLSRTLFVGNLPTNTSVKALKKFFSSFGPVEHVRYHPIETDRNKIFKHGRPKEQNLHYAAESLHGYIVFRERQCVIDALSLSGSLFENRHITVDFAQPAGSQKRYDDARSIFIGNVPFDIQDEAVWNALAGCGKIERVRIVRDRNTGIGKGFGYVQFSSVQAKENALALEHIEIGKRSIRIKDVDSSQKSLKKSTDKRSVKRDPFKSRAINFKKTHKDLKSRKTVKKIMKKHKNLHKKKKIASFLQKGMK